MTTISNLVAPRAAFTVQKKKNKARTVQVRQSREEEGYDSDSESFTKRTMRRGMRKSTLLQRSQSSPSQLARPLRRRQVVAPQPEPENDAEDDEEESEDEEESAVDGESSDSSSDSDADGVESGESDSSLDSISSGSEDEESEEEEEEETPSPGGAENTESAPANPGFQTLVPGGGPSQTGEESLQPTESSSTSVEAIPAATTTATTRPTEPTGEATDTIVNEGPIPDSESTSSIIEATSTIVNGEGSSLPTGETSSSDPASASQIGDSDSGSPRGADVGIVLGTLAIAALIIAAGIFFYRKRRQSNMDHIERLPDEKALPPEPPTFRLSAPAPPRFPRTQSSIMDEAMGAAYQADNQGYVQNDLSRDFQPAAYEQNMKPALAVAVAPVSPVSPDSPRANNLSPRWTPASPRAPQQQQQQMANFQLYPATTAPPIVPPLPAARVQGQPFMSSNQQFRFDQPRMSVARTETTEGEEGTWSTFANERMRANGGKLPFKERVLGHF